MDIGLLFLFWVSLVPCIILNSYPNWKKYRSWSARIIFLILGGVIPLIIPFNLTYFLPVISRYNFLGFGNIKSLHQVFFIVFEIVGFSIQYFSWFLDEE